MTTPQLSTIIAEVKDVRPVMWQDTFDGHWETGTELNVRDSVRINPGIRTVVLVRLSFSNKIVWVEGWRLQDRPMNPE